MVRSNSATKYQNINQRFMYLRKHEISPCATTVRRDLIFVILNTLLKGSRASLCCPPKCALFHMRDLGGYLGITWWPHPHFQSSATNNFSQGLWKETYALSETKPHLKSGSVNDEAFILASRSKASSLTMMIYLFFPVILAAIWNISNWPYNGWGNTIRRSR